MPITLIQLTIPMLPTVLTSPTPGELLTEPMLLMALISSTTFPEGTDEEVDTRDPNASTRSAR